MTKSQFSFATGINPYQLKKHLREKASKYAALGVHKYDKLLMPAAVRELCQDFGVQVDIDYYSQYVAGQRGVSSQVEEK